MERQFCHSLPTLGPRDELSPNLFTLYLANTLRSSAYAHLLHQYCDLNLATNVFPLQRSDIIYWLRIHDARAYSTSKPSSPTNWKDIMLISTETKLKSMLNNQDVVISDLKRRKYLSTLL